VSESELRKKTAQEAFDLVKEGHEHEQKARDYELESLEHALRANRCYNSALWILLEVFNTPLIRYCANMVGEDNAEDIAERAFFAARGGFPRFRGENGVLGLRRWLFTIATNLCLKELNRRKREVQAANPLDNAVVDFSKVRRIRPGRLKWYERWEGVSEEEIRRAIEQLKDETNKIILKMDMQPTLTVKDIAYFLDKEEAAVRQRIYRASLEVAAILGL